MTGGGAPDLKKGTVIVTASPEETEAVGGRLAASLAPGSVVALTGELGSGKTCLVQGIARGLGVKGYIKSPSFTIINIYEGGRLPLYHADLYRLAAAELAVGELETVGLEEYLYGDGVTVVEWAERAMDEMPDGALVLAMTYVGESERRIEVLREAKL